MTDLRGDSMTGEQFVFEERAADPASSVEGERWLRTDLNSGDKLATLRVDVGGSTLDVPVFPTGTSEDGVTEALRVRVGAQTGYIPAIADTSTAGFPQLRLQHDGQVYGYHNEQGVFAFFDVAISSTNSPVDEGSDLNVDYSVQNTGFSANNTQDIRLNIDSTEEDRDTNITLSPSSSTTGTLTWNTPSSSAGTYNASVLSDDDTASTSVTVEAGPPIPDSGIARYTFDDADTSGDTALDLFNNNNATINGATTGVAGLAGTYDSGEAYSFDGVNDRVDTPVSPQSGGFSFGGWVSLDSQSNGSFSRATDGSNNQAVIRYNPAAGRIEFFTFDGTFHGLRESGVGLSNGVATHIIGAFDSTDGYTLYKNGSVAASDPSTTFIVPSATFVIGANTGGGDHIPADMDDWQYYAKGITDTEASNWYNTGNIL